MPPTDFASRDELLAGAKAWAASQGFAVVIARSRPKRLWLRCDRGGFHEGRHIPPEQRKRKARESRLVGCTFRMRASEKKDNTWHVVTQEADHNHPPSQDLRAHPSLRKMTEAQTQKVNEMQDSGHTPIETLEELKMLWPDSNILIRDIYNARKKYKSEKEATANDSATTQTSQTLGPNPPTSSGTGASNGPAAPSPVAGAMIMSRINGIEREQKEQKRMLAQILGAVQAMSAASAPRNF